MTIMRLLRCFVLLLIVGCTETSSPVTSALTPGQRVRLFNADHSVILVFRTRQANLDALAADRNKDTVGVNEILARSTFPTPDETSAQVIECEEGWLVANVRLLDGPNAGMS